MDVMRDSFIHRGLRLSYLDSAPGDRARPVVLLLHGFPDTATMWQAQIDALHAAGYRCVAPDTVGCGESEIAPKRTDYDARTIIDDHAALLRHLDIAQADVVGHDWGAVLAWMLAGWHPHLVRRLVTLSVGHPMAYARAGLDQKLVGWYILFFQLGGLSERLLGGDGRFSLRRVFGSHPDMDEVMRRLAVPGRLTAALRIYRASLVTVLLRRQPRVHAPTLGIWSDRDAFLVESQMQRSERYVDALWRYERVAGHHWIPLQHPAWLNERLLRFFAESVDGTPAAHGTSQVATARN